MTELITIYCAMHGVSVGDEGVIITVEFDTWTIRGAA